MCIKKVWQGLLLKFMTICKKIPRAENISISQITVLTKKTHSFLNQVKTNNILEANGVSPH